MTSQQLRFVDLGIIDSHVHLWDRGVFAYPWLDELDLDGPYHISHLPPTVAGIRLDGFLFVQAECVQSESFAEVQWVLNQANEHTSIFLRGVVAKVDLTSPTAPTEIERLARNETVVGVRHNIQGQPRGFAQTLRDGANELAAQGLSFDLCCHASELTDVLALVESCNPTVRFVLDHLGKPTVGDDARFDAWAGCLNDLAAAPNIACKLSGLQTQLSAGTPNRFDAFAPYLCHAVSAFGIDRVIYGSDWPVCTMRGSMNAWAQVVAGILGDDEAAHRRVFRDNAIRLYDIESTLALPFTDDATPM